MSKYHGHMVVSGPGGLSSVRPVSMYDTGTVGAPILGPGALNDGKLKYWQGRNMATPGMPMSHGPVGFSPMPSYFRYQGGAPGQVMPAQVPYSAQEARGGRQYNGQLQANGQVAGGPVQSFFIQ